MNNYQIRGWVEQIVEVAFAGAENAAKFQQLVASEPVLQNNAQIIPHAVAGQPLGAMMEGQIENAVYVRVSCPALLAAEVFPRIRAVAMQAAPPSPQE